MVATHAFRTRSAAQRGTKNRFQTQSRQGIGSQAGFTLIEIIVSLILVGILAAMGGTAIVQVVQGYMTTRENSTMTQKAQLAMSRITREIIEMINIPSDATATALPINNINGNRTIGLNSGAVKMAFGTDTLTNGDILIDNVSAFTLTYYSRNASSGAVVTASTWPATNDITTLTTIDISLQINRAGGGTLAFANRVAPRNNKNEGGAAPSVPPPSAPTYGGGGCVVATAAYGDPGHPMVQILRDFRDRYLLRWGGGRWLVEQYYSHGPAAADQIRNRPLAMSAVRGLLTPIAALIFLLLYAPLAIPVLILGSLILTAALFSAVRRGAIPLRSAVFRARGSVLIGLIVTMVIMATLSAAMLSMFSSSYMNQAYADQGRKSYFLAESGFRYAASQFLNATGEAGRLAAMTAMNNKTCNLLNNAGSFTTLAYPFWFKSQAAAAGATTLSTQVYGTIPTEFSGGFSAGQIRVGSVYYSYSSGSGSGTTITFSGLSPALPLIPATPQLDAQPVAQPGSTQSLSKGGSLTLSGTGSGVFPLLNGNFVLVPAPTGIPSGAVFNYTKRTGTTLSNITLSDGTQNTNWTSSVSVAASTRVLLDKFIRLSSTGTIGNTSREVIYNVPVGWIAGGGQDFIKRQDIDPMSTVANWVAPSGGSGFGGTYSAQTVGGGGALKVDSAPDSGVWGNWAQTFYNGYSNTSLANAWMDAQGCLSYDIQVKVYNTQPYFFAGMNFRARNNSNDSDLYMYGVSFIRQRETRTKPQGGSWSAWAQDDGIAPSLRPFSLGSGMTGAETIQSGSIEIEARYSAPAIILWQRNGPATGTGSFKILAYRTITSADGLTTGSGTSLRLKAWATLMVRLVEGYALPFTLGKVDAANVHLRYGDTITSLDGTKSARIIGTPIISTNWGTANTTVAAGTLILSNVQGAFANGNDLYLAGGTTPYARASGNQAATKANFIMVYYGDDKSPATGNTVQADNTDVGNPRDSVNWPPDDWTDRSAANDYLCLIGNAIRWTNLYTTTDGYGNAASYVTALSTTDLYRAVIRTGALVSPAWTSSSIAADFNSPGDAISLSTSSNNAASTYYDDFAIQLDQKAGTGFLPPIQQ